MPTQQSIERDLQHYEGLVRKTASMYVGVVEEEYEDLCSIIRIKCWRALESFDPAKASGKPHDPRNKVCRCARCRFVFSCVKNLTKDLVKRNRRNWLFIEDVAPHNAEGNGVVRDAFESRYLEMSPEEAFRAVEDEFTLPSSLTERERQVLGLLYLSFDYGEIAGVVGVSHRDVSTAVRGIKEKMADWKPDRSEGKDD